LWSDAWLLHAIALASSRGPATLADILGAADGVQHAMPTADELHGAFSRLTQGGFVEERTDGFTLGPSVSDSTRASLLEAGRTKASRLASELLGAEEWTSERNVGDPRNRVLYPGLTDERLRAADQEYRERVRANRATRRGTDAG
jgi:hypothetical protein